MRRKLTGLGLVALMALGGCADMTTMQRVGTGAVVGAVAAGLLGANVGWGATAGVAGGLLSKSVN